MVEPGAPALDALVERFGPGILDGDGRLDRPGTGRDRVRRRRGPQGPRGDHLAGDRRGVRAPDPAAPPDSVVVCDVPLLVESKAAAARPYVAVIVVEAPIDVRLERLEIRGVPRDDAERRMAAQATDDERRAVATHLVDNGGDRDALAAQIDRIWEDILSREPPGPDAGRPSGGRRTGITVVPRR